MIYLNHIFLTSQGIVQELKGKKEILKRPSGNAMVPSELEKFQRQIRKFFFDHSLSNEQILLCLETDKHFDSYPRFKEIIKIILQILSPDEIEERINLIDALEDSDWHLNPEKFTEYNGRYGYFSDESVSIRELFENLTTACRAQIVLFEQNNSPDDNKAYEYAYKLMAIFINQDGASPENLYTLIHQLMQSVDNDPVHPLHELFTVKLYTLPSATYIKDRTGWCNLIKLGKINALPFFMQATRIEEKLALKAPLNLKEARDIFLQCQYHRANEDFSFALICQKYKVAEARFNQCLDYMATAWPKKMSDDIPDIVIEGSNLIWLKLPISDKRSLILGDITSCCQSIGGESEQCVRDAVGLSSNGLYVLLKRKHKEGRSNPLIDGQINEKDFKIIGQSYIWKSILGNICLDSFESLRGEVQADDLRAILSDFAERLLAENPDINVVTLGKGGNTPARLVVFKKLCHLF